MRIENAAFGAAWYAKRFMRRIPRQWNSRMARAYRRKPVAARLKGGAEAEKDHA